MYRLREIEKKDLAVITRWRNDQELSSYLGGVFRFINTQTDETWFERYMSDRNRCVRCAIVNENENVILGLVSLVSIDHINQSAEFHIMIGDRTNQEHGIGTYAVNEMLRHAFLNLNLRRIELSVLESNKRAQHLYEKSGFVMEGIKRQARYKNGKFCDMYLYALLREDYLSGK